MAEKTKFSVAIKSDAYRNLINDTLGDQKTAQRFVAEITSVVATNEKLQLCEPKTILSAGLLAQTMNLPLAPTLGFAYIIPYGDNATFQVGWKGLVQLAIRTGDYERLGVNPVHEGEVAGQDEFGDDIIKFDHKFDDKPIVGYFAYFKLVSGYKKSIYWSKEKCLAHGKKYSAEFRTRGSGKWVDMQEEMCMKTVLKQLISKWGSMSTDAIKTAVQADQAVIRGEGKYDYVDNVADEDVKSKKTNINNSLADKVKVVEEDPIPSL